jgi:archaellum component FlaC
MQAINKEIDSMSRLFDAIDEYTNMYLEGLMQQNDVIHGIRQKLNELTANNIATAMQTVDSLIRSGEFDSYWQNELDADKNK